MSDKLDDGEQVGLKQEMGKVVVVQKGVVTKGDELVGVGGSSCKRGGRRRLLRRDQGRIPSW